MSLGSAVVNRFSMLLVAMLLVAACKDSRHRTGASSSPQPQQTATEPSVSGLPAITACNLITSEEVGAIQNATITDARSSVGSSGDLVVSQSYYISKEPNMAVSFAVLQPSSQGATGTEARDYWEKMRGSAEESAGKGAQEQRESEREEENEKKSPPKKIDGVGEEAFWIRSRVGGALYVLKDQLILRISVGGGQDIETKIARSKALAEKAINRL